MGAIEFLKSIQFYRKVHSDFTDTSISTGVISILAAITMTFLFFSQLSEYLNIKEEVSMIMDENTSEKVRINFNITMQYLPCRFASVDVSDRYNEHYVNITTHIAKWRIVSVDGNQERVASNPILDTRFDSRTENKATPTPALRPDQLNHYSDDEENAVEVTVENFDEILSKHDFSMVNFYAPWCFWSNRLKPIWEHTAGFFKDNRRVFLGRCDCTKPENRQLCQRNHIMAFPTMRVFRLGQTHSHEYYDGDRETSALMEYINREVEALGVESVVDRDGSEKLPSIVLDGQAFQNIGREKYEDTTRGPEGCMLTGYVMVNRAPGNFHIQATAAEHSFNADSLNTTHYVTYLTFGNPLTARQLSVLNKDIVPYVNTLGDSYFPSRTLGVTREHYVKIVHTTYYKLGAPSTRDHKKENPNVLSTYQYTTTETEYAEHPPSAKFSFDLSPTQIVVRQTRKSLSTFATSVCAIVGGVFTVIGLVDSVLYHSLNVLHKQQIGKLG